MIRRITEFRSGLVRTEIFSELEKITTETLDKNTRVKYCKYIKSFNKKMLCSKEIWENGKIKMVFTFVQVGLRFRITKIERFDDYYSYNVIRNNDSRIVYFEKDGQLKNFRKGIAKVEIIHNSNQYIKSYFDENRDLVEYNGFAIIKKYFEKGKVIKKETYGKDGKLKEDDNFVAVQVKINGEWKKYHADLSEVTDKSIMQRLFL